MRLGNALTLTSIYAEGEAELQEASTEAELHGHSLGGTRLLGAVGWHVSGSLRTRAGSSQPVTGVAFAVRTPPHYSARKNPANEDAEVDDDDPPGFRRQHDQWEDWPQDEIGMSQLAGAPLSTQGAS